MDDELRRKGVVSEYFRRLNAGDVTGVLDLLAHDAGIEDPVGSDRREGHAAAREYVDGQVRGQVRVTPGTLVAAHDKEQVAVPYTISAAGRVTNALGIFRIGPNGSITEFRAFWGLTDRE